jgi:fructoselysine-6-P-deglycase FrlB-like protein
MSMVHPMLRNILSLADRGTWQKSIDLAEQALSAWSQTAHPFNQIYLVGHGSSLYNAQVGEYILEYIAGLPCKALPAFAFSAYMEHRRLDAQHLSLGFPPPVKQNPFVMHWSAPELQAR